MKVVTDSLKLKSGFQASAFSLIALSLVEKVGLHIFVMVDYVKSALRNRQQIPSNVQHF